MKKVLFGLLVVAVLIAAAVLGWRSGLTPAVFGFVGGIFTAIGSGLKWFFTNPWTWIVLAGLLTIAAIVASFFYQRVWMIAVLLGLLTGFLVFRLWTSPAATSPTGTPVSAPAGNPKINDSDASLHFDPSNLPDCTPVNGPWLDAFAKGQYYEFNPASEIFNQGNFNYFEGVIIPSSPIDLHSVLELRGNKFIAQQGNVWTCGVVTDDQVKHTILFQSADKKWQNWDGQPDKPFHAISVTTMFGQWYFEAGNQPTWALDDADTNLICPFADPSRSDPAGAIQPDGSFIGAPGKAGCDFVAVGPDGSALRYHGAIDSFPYQAGTRFFLFDPSLSNETVAKAINVGTVTDAK